MTIPLIKEQLPIALRAYVRKVQSDKPNSKQRKKKQRQRKELPSEWVLIFDTETATNASQQLRFGTYQVRHEGCSMEKGVFYDPLTLSKDEKQLLIKYATGNDLHCLTVEEFIEGAFYYYGYDLRGTIVGLNLPFDLSRLAIGHSPARISPNDKIMQGGFSLKLSENTYRPRVQIKHLSRRAAFIRFAAKREQRSNKSVRKRNEYEPVFRGYFIDAKTIAAALTNNSYSLDSLAQYLGVQSQKHKALHGRKLTKKYIEYAIQDTQVTWECYQELIKRYEMHCLTETLTHKILSEAGLGKAYLREMGIKPQPEFPPKLLGRIISAYYGGRSEVHARREIVQVLYCDFLSMYPTVCTLMGLWRFVIAEGMQWQDSTIKTREWLSTITLEDLQKQDTWKLLCTLVKVRPNDEVFPARAQYGYDRQYTIGLNHLESDQGIWYTLADCIAAKLLTGQTLEILQAISFLPGKMQKGLKPVNIMGNPDYCVHPGKDDFFKRVIDLRTSIKAQMKMATGLEREQLDTQQQALKILANATSYGIFVELNVEESKWAEEILCFGALEQPFAIRKTKFEAPGTYFHPLLATLITGAARLMLAIAERLALDMELDWAFCDTDSMALAKPHGMQPDTFYAKACIVHGWFTPLNPYSKKEPLFKIEDHNYKNGKLCPLFCYAISSKRYALFNLDDKLNPVLRKVSAHGLGHLIAPYQRQKTETDLDDVEYWQQDFWMEIIKAALRGTPDEPVFSKLRNFHLPAMSRYAATSPHLERWFKNYNKGKAYRDSVRPFGFFLSAQAGNVGDIGQEALRPVTPFNKNVSEAIKLCFDRDTGQPVQASSLKSYRDVLAQYHLHSESKFLNGEYTDRGFTQRRHIKALAFQHIGKEANKWEEQYFLGLDLDAQLEYGISPLHQQQQLEIIKQATKKYHLRPLARAAGISYQQLSTIVNKNVVSHPKTLAKLQKAIRKWNMDKLPTRQ